MATCNIQSLMDSAKCFTCLSPGILQILELQLLCEILAAGGGGGGGGGSAQLLHGAFANPNGNVTPTDQTSVALYTQDGIAPSNNVWRWDVDATAWYQIVSP